MCLFAVIAPGCQTQLGSLEHDSRLYFDRQLVLQPSVAGGTGGGDGARGAGGGDDARGAGGGDGVRGAGGGDDSLCDELLKLEALGLDDREGVPWNDAPCRVLGLDDREGVPWNDAPCWVLALEG